MASTHGAHFPLHTPTPPCADPKRWRMVSAISLDCANLVEVITPLFPSLFLPLASLANVGKNISWLASSASRAGIHGSFALSGNL